MEKDGETTRKELVKILKAEGVEASVSSVLRWRKDLGWTLKGTSYCQMIRDANEKRLNFAQENKEMYILMKKQRCKLQLTDRHAVTRKVANLTTSQS